MIRLGLIGGKLGHSYSPILHKMLMAEKGIEGTYELLELSKDELKSYIDKLRNGVYHGFNVTIPYKIEIMKYLDEVDDIAKEIGAVNTVYLKDGKVCGTNTDYYGFKGELEHFRIFPRNKECYVLGTGGASLAIKKVLTDMKGFVTRVSRNSVGKDIISYDELENKRKIGLLVNTTPVGMYPNMFDCPVSDNVIEVSDTVVDVIFNPQETVLVKKSKKGFGGLMMLFLQGVKSEEYWLGTNIEMDTNKMFRKFKELI